MGFSIVYNQPIMQRSQKEFKRSSEKSFKVKNSIQKGASHSKQPSPIENKRHEKDKNEIAWFEENKLVLQNMPTFDQAGYFQSSTTLRFKRKGIILKNANQEQKMDLDIHVCDTCISQKTLLKPIQKKKMEAYVCTFLQKFEEAEDQSYRIEYNSKIFVRGGGYYKLTQIRPEENVTPKIKESYGVFGTVELLKPWKQRNFEIIVCKQILYGYQLPKQMNQRKREATILHVFDRGVNEVRLLKRGRKSQLRVFVRDEKVKKKAKCDEKVEKKEKCDEKVEKKEKCDEKVEEKQKCDEKVEEKQKDQPKDSSDQRKQLHVINLSLTEDELPRFHHLRRFNRTSLRSHRFSSHSER